MHRPLSASTAMATCANCGSPTDVPSTARQFKLALRALKGHSRHLQIVAIAPGFFTSTLTGSWKSLDLWRLTRRRQCSDSIAQRKALLDPSPVLVVEQKRQSGRGSCIHPVPEERHVDAL
jgi:hypothetical protein